MESFFDEIFFAMAVIVVVLSALDWWLGEAGRAQMRERVGEWWLYLEETSIRQITIDDTQTIRNYLLRLFGKPLSVSFFLRAVVLSMFTTVVVTAALGIVVHANELLRLLSGSLSFSGWFSGETAWQWFVNRGLSFLLPNALLDWLGLLVAIVLLGWMTQARSLLAWVSLLIVDGLIVMVFVWSVWLVGTSAFGVLHFHNSQRSAFVDQTALDPLVFRVELMSQSFQNIVYRGNPPEYIDFGDGIAFEDSSESDQPKTTMADDFCESNYPKFNVHLEEADYASEWRFGLTLWLAVLDFSVDVLRCDTEPLTVILQMADLAPGNVIVWVIAFTSAIPILLHLGFISVTLVLKLFPRLVQPVVARVLYLVYESKKGVLTQVSVFVAVIIKLGQEILKRL